MSYVVRPLNNWPADRKCEYRDSRFELRWHQIEGLIEREVRHLQGVRREPEFVIEVDATERDIRLDGRLKAKANPSSPRVAVAFDTPDGPIKFHCSRYRVWQDNLQAIGASMEALRKVDRYGVTNKGEQYTGWRAIGTGRASEAMDRDTALRVLEDLSGYDDPAADIEAAFREAAKHAHPDLGGSDEAFVALTQAREVLA